MFTEIGEHIRNLILEEDLEFDEIEEIMDTIHCIVNEVPIMMGYIAKMLMAVSPRLVPKFHICSEVIYLDDEHKEQSLKAIEKFNNDNTIDFTDENEKQTVCKCSLIALCLSYPKIIIQDELILKMFGSLDFKALLAFTYVENYIELCKRKLSAVNFVDYGLQTLNNSEISLRIIIEESLRLKIFEVLQKSSFLDQNDYPGISGGQLFTNIITDLIFILKPPQIEYLLYQ